jgi:hypothetical protein
MHIDEKLLVRYLQNECTENEILILNDWLSEREKNKQELFLLEAALKSHHLKRYSDPEFLQAEKNKLQERIDREEKK